MTLSTIGLKGPVTLAATAIGAAATGNLIEGHDMSMSTACAIAGVVIPAAWWLSQKLQRIEDNQHHMNDRLGHLEKQITNKRNSHD